MEKHHILRSSDHWRVRVLVIAIATALFAAGCTQTKNEAVTGPADANRHEAAIPRSIMVEHRELHEQLEGAMRSGGATGDAAKLVADRLAPHFAKEEKFALPPLALLRQLAQGRTTDHPETIKLSEQLRAELPQMLNEHKEIAQALDALADAARTENKAQAIEFAEKLKLHAQNEEEILYPAAILVGDHLKMRAKP